MSPLLEPTELPARSVLGPIVVVAVGSGKTAVRGSWGRPVAFASG